MNIGVLGEIYEGISNLNQPWVEVSKSLTY